MASKNIHFIGFQGLVTMLEIINFQVKFQINSTSSEFS